MTLDLKRPAAIDAAERYLHLPRPLFTRMPMSYRMIPLGVRTRVLRLLARVRPADGQFPVWPIEASLDAGLIGSDYAGRRAVVVLTHDVDSRAELDLIESIRMIERSAGVVSAWGFVPDLSWPPEQLVRALVAEGCEVYWHDVSHDGRLPYLDAEEIRTRFDVVAKKSPWAVELMRAFRSGQLLISPNLIEAVAERFAIDMSIPDTERHGPHGATAGCGTIYPFMIRGLLELPLTMPQDVFLREVEGLSPEATLAVWEDKLRYIKKLGGVAVLNVHPVWASPGRPEMLDAFAKFVQGAAADEDLLVTTPTELRDLLVPARTAA